MSEDSEELNNGTTAVAASATISDSAAINIDGPIEYRDVIIDGRMAKYAYACSCERADGRLAYRFFKRLFDIVFSALVIVVLLIPSLLLCVAIRIESSGSPIYIQHRVGRIGKHGEVITFPMLKFRSMYKDADERLAELKDLNEADGPLFKMKDDPRVTKIGGFIRKHSLASVIIGTPGDGESTKSLSRSANSSLDLQLCECRPGLCSTCNSHYKPFEFLSLGIFGGVPSLSRNLVGCNGFSPSEESAIRFSFLGFGKDGACAAW